MMAIANEPDLFNIVDVLLSSFSGAAAGAASAAPWRVPPKFLLPAEADGQAKKRAHEHGPRGDGTVGGNPCWILLFRRVRPARAGCRAGGGAGTAAGPAVRGRPGNRPSA